MPFDLGVDGEVFRARENNWVIDVLFYAATSQRENMRKQQTERDP